MKLWIDDVQPAPAGYVWCKSVNQAKRTIEELEENVRTMEYYFYNHEAIFDDVERYIIMLIDINHDAGDYAQFGGDYIRLLDWLEETGRNYPIRIHSVNPVGVVKMRTIIQRNGWTEVQ